jgi:hypothetical protein
MTWTYSYLEFYSQGGLVPFEIEIDKKDLDYLMKNYPLIFKDNNKKLYRINKENLLKNNSISNKLIEDLNECRGETLVVEIWDDENE